METDPVEVDTCPPQVARRALEMVLAELPDPQLQAVLAEYGLQEGQTPRIEGLFAALRSDELLGAAWAQRQPGNTALFWPPRLKPTTAADVACSLGSAATAHLDKSGIGLTQSLLERRSDPVTELLEALGFFHLADLLYMVRETGVEPVSEGAAAASLKFVPYTESYYDRLIGIIRQTYEQTLDCPRLNNARPLAQVVDGYRATGRFDPSNWFLIEANGKDVGVLLLADHDRQYWELIYMGLVPAGRRRGWGRAIVQQAVRRARQAAIDRIVLAVDARNQPALRAYRQAGFRVWDERAAWVRLPGGTRC